MEVLLKGLLKVFVLYSAARPVSGQEIALSIKDLTDGEWRPSPGTVYPLLSSLTRKGFLKRKANGKSVLCSRTKKGAVELEREKARLLDSSEKMMRMAMPLVMAVVHGFSRKEVEDFRKEQEGFLAFRRNLLALPKHKRVELMKAMMEQCTRLK